MEYVVLFHMCRTAHGKWVPVTT